VSSGAETRVLWGCFLDLVAPIFVWELSLGIYLVVKGFRPSPITAGMAAASTPPAYRDVDA